MREIRNGSFEQIWRYNARNDADKLKREVLIDRRTFLGGLGVALAAEYVAMRRAVAMPLPHGGSGLTQITNQRTGVAYQYLPAALYAMQNGDTILLPAGLTYQYSGSTYYYANYLNMNCAGYPGVSGSGYGSMYLGNNSVSPYGGFLPNCDYGSIQAVGTANNGRALLAPSYGILAQDFLTTDTEMYFVPSTPASNFLPTGNSVFTLANYNGGQFANTYMNYTGVDNVNNGLTGVTGTRAATIPAGTLITSFLYNQNKALFVTCGQNPGWTFSNLELAYAAYASYSAVTTSIQLSSSNPGGPYVGSMTLNNCYIHDCKQGPGLGSTGTGNVPTFMYLFNTELTTMGCYNNSASANHNIYVGHIGELLMDNCYSHDTDGTWLVKSRAALSLLTYNQIRGERTDANAGENENSGCDFSNGGLVYLIGNIHQQSLYAANQTINFAAEASQGGGGTNEGGAANAAQELYIINGTMIGPSNGVGYSVGAGAGKAPVKLNNIFVHSPELTLLSQSSAGALAARDYYVVATILGATSGETPGSPLRAPVGAAAVNQRLSVSANKVLGVASPATNHTGAGGWNCYANYADPMLYLSSLPYPQTQEGNLYFWDAGFTQPVFSQTSGGTTV
jgi:hypothetical protein